MEDLNLRLMEDALQTLVDFSESLTGQYPGCPQNDCIWHCLAYISSKGKYFNETYARRVCYWYYNSNEVYQPFEGYERDVRAMVNTFIGRLKPNSYLKDKCIFVFERRVVHEGNNIIRMNHAVIVEKNKYIQNNSIRYFDPMYNQYYTMSIASLPSEHYFISIQ